jgi:dTDP-4-amino-4,6-dideoxygalactose transaminase
VVKTSRAFRVVEMFEEAMCEYTGARYGVATESCSMALFLSLIYIGVKGKVITIPKRTYISVPAAIRHAGGLPAFADYAWSGAYFLDPTMILDSALRLHHGMYQPDTLTCVSFHMRKILPIGRGGMILTDDTDAADWLRRARFDGRTGSVPFLLDQVTELGWNGYMTPEQAARGLQLLENLPADPPDLTPDYPDLSKLPALH